MIASGVADPDEGYRPNNLYFYTGSGTLPVGDIRGESGVVVVADPFSSADGSQIDTFEREFEVPAGNTYACFQTESVNSAIPKGASFVWQAGAFNLRDEGPNAVNLQSLTAVSPSNLLLLITGLAGLLFLAVPTAVVITNRRRQK